MQPDAEDEPEKEADGGEGEKKAPTIKKMTVTME